MSHMHHENRPDPYRFLPDVPTFTLSSTTVENNGTLPAAQRSGIFGAGGQDVSPQLSWGGFPPETQSFVVSVYDPGAPTGSGFWHWVVANLPASVTSLPEGAGVPDSVAIPAGGFQLSDASQPRYIGAAPSAGSGVHYYTITVTALDVAEVGVKADATPALLGFMLSANTIARATLTAISQTD